METLKLRELDVHEMKGVNGGVILAPWRQIIKWGSRAFEALGVYEACEDIYEGYQACRNK